MTRKLLPIGARYGKLVIVADAGVDPVRQHSVSQAACDCGALVLVKNSALTRTPPQLSCGCWRRERTGRLNLRHGHTRVRTDGAAGTPTYSSWMSMVVRCTNPKASDYSRYGGRGITVCARWLDHVGFDNFLADMGERPDGATIDRVDVNGNYEPSNCRWATATEQARNKRNTAYLTVGGVTRCVAEWAEVTGLSRRSIDFRIGAGWNPEDIISKPLRIVRRHKEAA